jgi:hypothetical protein
MNKEQNAMNKEQNTMKIETIPPPAFDRSLPMHELTARRNRRRIFRPLPPGDAPGGQDAAKPHPRHEIPSPSPADLRNG